MTEWLLNMEELIPFADNTLPSERTFLFMTACVCNLKNLIAIPPENFIGYSARISSGSAEKFPTALVESNLITDSNKAADNCWKCS